MPAMISNRSIFIFILFFAAVFNLSAKNYLQSPEQVVEKLYELVTFDKGENPDWDEVKNLFLPEAIVVLRTSYTETKVFTLNGFVDDFKNFIEKANVTETGFSEAIIKKHSMVFGDIAYFLVLYDAQINGSPRKTTGVDHFSLIKKNGVWKIISITNELPTDERPLPKELAN